MLRGGRFIVQRDDEAGRERAGIGGSVKPMLYTIAVILLVLWLLGLVTSSTFGGFLHILLVVAVVMVILRLLTGRSH